MFYLEKDSVSKSMVSDDSNCRNGKGKKQRPPKEGRISLAFIGFLKRPAGGVQKVVREG